MIQPFLLLLALMWLIASQPPRYLVYYILTQGAVTLILYSTLIFHDETTYEYAHIWGLCTVLLASSYFVMSYHFLSKNPRKFVTVICAFLFGFCCAFPAYRHILRHNLASWLGLSAGFILIASGIILCSSAPYHPKMDRIVALVLGLLFISQSLWNLGFILHSSPWWDRANYVFPTTMCVAGWLYLGMKLRQAVPECT